MSSRDVHATTNVVPIRMRAPQPHWSGRALRAALVFALGVLVGACTHLLR